MGPTRKRSPRAFTAVELAAAVAAGVVICAFLVLIGSNQRRLARLGDDIAHMKEIGQGTFQYQADNADLFCTFSWQHGQVYQTQYPDLGNAADDLQAGADQLVYLLRTRGGLSASQMPRVIGSFAHPLYTTVVLADYLDKSLPWLPAVSSGDTFRLRWEGDPACFRSHCIGCQPDPAGPGMRWLFSASYQPSVSFYDRSPVGRRISQAGEEYNLYLDNYPTLGGITMSNVARPSQKVVYAPQNAWHFGSRQPFCTHIQARLPLLMAEGSVPVRSAADANPGWDPNNPSATTTILYDSTSAGRCWDSPSLTVGGDFVLGRFRYTRNGIAGRDFGGPEIP